MKVEMTEHTNYKEDYVDPVKVKQLIMMIYLLKLRMRIMLM
jgi:hypothetical protein